MSIQKTELFKTKKVLLRNMKIKKIDIKSAQDILSNSVYRKYFVADITTYALTLNTKYDIFFDIYGNPKKYIKMISEILKEDLRNNDLYTISLDLLFEFKITEENAALITNFRIIDFSNPNRNLDAIFLEDLNAEEIRYELASIDIFLGANNAGLRYNIDMLYCAYFIKNNRLSVEIIYQKI